MSSIALLSELSLIQQRADAVLVHSLEGSPPVPVVPLQESVQLALANKLSDEQSLREQYRVAKIAFDIAVNDLELTQNRYKLIEEELKKFALLLKKKEDDICIDRHRNVFLHIGAVFNDNMVSRIRHQFPEDHFHTSQFEFLRLTEKERYLHWLDKAQRDIVSATQAEATTLGQKLITIHTEIKKLEEMLNDNN